MAVLQTRLVSNRRADPGFVLAMTIGSGCAVEGNCIGNAANVTSRK